MNLPRKRRYLINRDFQLRYSMAAVVVGIVSACLTCLVVLYPLYQFEILRIPKFLPLPILATMGSTVLINILMVGLMGIFITHRIAGPMYSLVRCFRRIESGLWAGHLRIREQDDLKYLVRNFNQMVDSLVANGRTDLQLVEKSLNALGDGVSAEAKEALSQLGSRIEQRIRENQVVAFETNDAEVSQND